MSASADDHASKSDERYREYQRRLRQARLDGGRSVGDAERADMLGKARDVALARHTRMTGHMQAEARGEPLLPHGKEPLEWLPPGHVAVPAEALLGFEIELADVLANREAVEQHRMGLLRLIARAREGVARAPMPNGPGEIDLFKLETALETGKGLPRDAEAQLLEVVRELIRWRLEVSPATHAEIRAKLQAAGYEHAFHREDDREVIDMHGIGVVAGADPGVASALRAWLDARTRRMAAAERLAALNVRSDYKRPDDAPEVLAYYEAQRAVDRAADDLYEVACREQNPAPVRTED